MPLPPLRSLFARLARGRPRPARTDAAAEAFAHHHRLRLVRRARGVTVLSGDADGIAVSITLRPRRTEVRCRARHAPLDARVGDRGGAPTGDPDLDALAGIFGPPLDVVACLHARARHHLRGLLTAGGTLSGGVCELVVPNLPATHAELRTLVNLVFRTAHALGGDDPVARAVEVARHDPVPTVRARAVGVLATHAAHDARVDRLLRDVARDRGDPRRALVAARHRGDAAALVQLARHREDGVSAAALAALRTHGAAGALAEGCAAALEAPTLGALRGVLDALPHVSAAARPALASHAFQIARDLAPSTRQEAHALHHGVTAALNRLTSEEIDQAAPRLVGSRNGPTEHVALAVLGARGTAAAVPALTRITAELPRFSTGRRRARHAIRAIQARVGPHRRGAVSLTQVRGGGLTVRREPVRGVLSQTLREP